MLGLHLARANNAALLGAIMGPPGSGADSAELSSASECLVLLLLPGGVRVTLLEEDARDGDGRLWQAVAYGATTGWVLEEFLGP